MAGGELEGRQAGRVGTTSSSAPLGPVPGRTTLAELAPIEAAPRTAPLFGDDVPSWEAIAPGETHAAAPATKKKPSLGGYDDLLLEALTKGDVPVAEFQNYVRQLDEASTRELQQRLVVTPPPATDKLAVAFYQVVPAADRTRILANLGTTVKAHSEERKFSALAPGEQSEELHLLTRIDAFDGVHLRAQPAGDKSGPVIPFGALVAVSRKTSKGWFYVTVIPDETPEGEKPTAAPVGASGFIESYHVATQMPEPGARLHKVASGELLKDIAAKYYQHAFAWGHDARLFVQAIYHANKGRDAVFRQQADLTVNKEALSTKSLDEALELWSQARVTSGQALWMPSHAFVSQLKAAGAINEASISKAVWDATGGALAEAWGFLKYAGGFLIGILEGAWGALEDLLMGVVDLVKMLWALIKDIFNDFSEMQALAKKISEAWKNRDAIVQEMATQFMDKWESPDDWARGNFQGEVLGYVMMTALITVVTFGSGAAIVGAGRFGAFIKLIQFADKAGSLGTYVAKLKGKIKLPKNVVEKTRQTLGAIDPPHTPDAPHPHGHTPDGPDAPKRAPDTPAADAPRAPHVETHTHRPARQNTGGPYVEPGSSPDSHTLPHAHQKKLPKIKDAVLSKWDAVVKAGKGGARGVPIGRKLKSLDEGHELLRRLAKGDATALDSLGMKGVPAGYNTMGREWALVEGRNGLFLYAGRYQDVGLPEGVRVHAHNHPDPHASAPFDANQKPTTDLPADVPHEGKSYAELVNDPDSLKAAGLAPSAADIHAISDGGEHVIYTRFVHRGGGKIANPIANEAGERVAMHLAGTKVVRYNPRVNEFIYATSVEIRDATGNKLWSGEMYTHWYAQTNNGIVHLKKHPQLDRPLPAGWKEP